MAKVTTVTCDACDADLSETGNCVDYRLALLNQNIPTRGGFVTAMGKYPAIEHDCYFCNVGCLDLWRARENFAKELRRQWHEKWVDEYGERHAQWYSYPEPSKEILAARDQEITEQVAAKFPKNSAARGTAVLE
jgi:hypothetical protein